MASSSKVFSPLPTSETNVGHSTQTIQNPYVEHPLFQRDVFFREPNPEHYNVTVVSGWFIWTDVHETSWRQRHLLSLPPDPTAQLVLGEPTPPSLSGAQTALALIVGLNLLGWTMKEALQNPSSDVFGKDPMLGRIWQEVCGTHL